MRAFHIPFHIPFHITTGAAAQGIDMGNVIHVTVQARKTDQEHVTWLAGFSKPFADYIVEILIGYSSCYQGWGV